MAKPLNQQAAELAGYSVTKVFGRYWLQRPNAPQLGPFTVEADAWRRAPDYCNARPLAMALAQQHAGQVRQTQAPDGTVTVSAGRYSRKVKPGDSVSRALVQMALGAAKQVAQAEA